MSPILINGVFVQHIKKYHVIFATVQGWNWMNSISNVRRVEKTS